MKKGKISAYLISFAMAFFIIINIPTATNAKVMPAGLDTPFALNDDGSVKAEWNKEIQTLNITGNGKIDIQKWQELAKKFSENNFKDKDNSGWNTNSNFILKIKDKTVKFPDNTLYKGYNGFFENFQGRIELAKIDTSNVVDMYSMFFGITGGNLNVDNWNTSNVTDMALMFYTATDLTPDVSGWNTSKVKDMSFMFSEVTFDPDVSDWNTSNVSDMSFMFYNAKNANPDVSNWNTEKLTDIESMFENSGVIEIDMSKWDMSKITKNKDVFKDTKQLEFLTFKGLPEETELTAFAGEYIVGTLNSNGDVISTEGPFNKNNKYKFKKNTPYKVYLSNSSGLKVKRIFGSNRYKTAIKSSKNLTNNSKKVFIASGESKSMIDALNVSPYAAVLKAPVLLTEKTEIAEETLSEIQRINASEAIIIGGTEAIGKNVEDQLKSKGLTVRRIFGNDRYDTALKVAEEAIEKGKLKENKIFLCSGESSADALSISSVSAKEEGIILLTNGNKLTDGVKKYIKSETEVKIIGGVAVISDNLKQEIEAEGAKVERIFGNDRFETSLNIYNKYYKSIGVKTVYLANGITMVDALTGAGLAYKDKTGLLLTNANKMLPSIKWVINGMTNLKILGGRDVVQNNIWK